MDRIHKLSIHLDFSGFVSIFLLLVSVNILHQLITNTLRTMLLLWAEWWKFTFAATLKRQEKHVYEQINYGILTQKDSVLKLKWKIIYLWFLKKQLPFNCVCGSGCQKLEDFWDRAQWGCIVILYQISKQALKYMTQQSDPIKLFCQLSFHVKERNANCMIILMFGITFRI